MNTLTVSPNTDNKIKLFHVSFFSNEPVEVFSPRIPVHRASSEDTTVNRICAAPTLEGCIAAHPLLAYYAHGYMETEYADPYEQMCRMHMLLEHGEAGILLRVYHLEVDKSLTCDDDTLKEFGYVPDAHQTGEHWILEECVPEKVTYMLLKDFKEDAVTGKLVPNYLLFDTLEEMGIGTTVPYDEFHSAIYRQPNPNELMVKKFAREEALSFIEAEQNYQHEQDLRYEEERIKSKKVSEQLTKDFGFTDDIFNEDLPF